MSVTTCAANMSCSGFLQQADLFQACATQPWVAMHTTYSLKASAAVQTAASLQQKLRQGRFNLVDRPSRMLPRIFNPVQLNVDCSAKTPSKPVEGKPKRGRPANRAADKGQGAEGDCSAYSCGVVLWMKLAVFCLPAAWNLHSAVCVEQVFELEAMHVIKRCLHKVRRTYVCSCSFGCPRWHLWHVTLPFTCKPHKSEVDCRY